MNSKILSLSSFLLCVLPIALVTGPFLSDLIVSVLGLIFLIYIFLKKKFFYLNNIFFKFFIFFNFYFILGSLFSKDPLFSLSSSLFYFRFAFFVLMVKFLLENNTHLIKNFFYSIFLTLVVVIFDGYFQFFFDKNILGFAKLGHDRLSGFFNDEGILGSYLSKLFFLSLSLFFLLKSDKLQKLYFLLFFILSYVLTYLTGERASFYLFSLSLLFCFLLLNFKIKIKLFIVAILLFIFSIIYIYSKKSSIRIINQTIAQINVIIFDIKDKNDLRIKKYIKDDSLANFIVTNQHGNHFQSAYKMFLDKKLFGHGLKMFRIICREDRYNVNPYSCTTHPHNSYIQILAEAGLIGLLFLLVPFMTVLYLSVKQFQHLYVYKKKFLSNSLVSLLGLFFMYLWPLTTNGNLFNNYLSVLYFLPLGFYLHIWDLKNA